jgi:SET domain-containing protein
MKIIITESQLLNVIKESNSFDVVNTLKKGYSLISKKNIKKGDKVGVVLSTTPSKKGRDIHDGWYETDMIGRYINHSGKPNTKLKKNGKEVLLYATQDINGGDEVTVHYGDVEKLLGAKSGSFLLDDFKD